MDTTQGINLKRIRTQLGKSQREMAELLGTSIRAVQSYEQGWRHVPDHVLRQAWTLMLLKRRGGTGAVAPCWEARPCDQATRESCPVYELRAGDLCWMFTSQSCCGQVDESLGERVARCEACPVLGRWLAG
jgi:DNA-binding XRE family transcriptional regulator